LLENLPADKYSITVVTNNYNQHKIKIGKLKKYVSSGSIIYNHGNNVSLDTRKIKGRDSIQVKQRVLPFWINKLPEGFYFIKSGNFQELAKKVKVYLKRRRRNI